MSKSNRKGYVPRGPNRADMPEFTHSESDTWRCRVCGYSPNLDKMSGNCVGCGRDYWGNPGKVPEIAANIHHARESGAT